MNSRLKKRKEKTQKSKRLKERKHYPPKNQKKKPNIITSKKEEPRKSERKEKPKGRKGEYKSSNLNQIEATEEQDNKRRNTYP